MNVLVIGVAFVDVKGFPYFKYDPLGTNKGNVVVNQGGAARNVAEDMAHLGAKVNLPLMLDDDAFGKAVETKLLEAGVDLSDAPRTSGNGIGMWLAVFNENGDLAGSISKMPDVTPMEKLIESEGERLVKNCDAVVLEFDTSEKIADMVMGLALRYNKPVYVIVGNMTVILKRRELLAKTSCIIMNEIEMGKVLETNLKGLSPDTVRRIILERGAQMGAERMVVTLGGDGCVYADFLTGENGHIPTEAAKIVDTTGAGDSFFSAAVLAMCMGKSLSEAVRYGGKLAAIVISQNENACPVLGEEFFS